MALDLWPSIKHGEFDCINDTSLDGDNKEKALLFALACGASIAHGHDMCDREYINESLQRCVACEPSKLRNCCRPQVCLTIDIVFVLVVLFFSSL